jgi:hypothetical protein
VLVFSVGLQAAPVAAQTPRGIAIEADGSIVVVGYNFVVGYGTDYEVIRVDPATGVVTTVSSSTVGSGPSLGQAEDIAVEPSGSLVVTLPSRGLQKVLRVDAVSGDRSVVSDLTIGSGPVFFPQSIATAGGALFVTQDQQSGDPEIIGVDPSTGDRSIVSGPSRGSGPAVKALTSIVVEPSGSLAVTEQLLDAVVRIDTATGDRTIVSDPHTGSGPRLARMVAITAAPDGTLAVADRGGDNFCVPFCPSELCQICLETAPSLVRVEPVSGDRTTVSGGGKCLTVGLVGCVTPYFGHTGFGPRFLAPTDVAVEAEGSYVLADNGLVDPRTGEVNPGLLRVNSVTGRRRVLAQFGTGSAGVEPAHGRGGTLARGLSRVYRLQDPETWMRNALGRDYGPLAATRPDLFFASLPAARRQIVGERLYAAMSRLLRDAPPPTSPTASDRQPRSHRTEAITGR